MPCRDHYWRWADPARFAPLRLARSFAYVARMEDGQAQAAGALAVGKRDAWACAPKKAPEPRAARRMSFETLPMDLRSAVSEAPVGPLETLQFENPSRSAE